MCFIGILNEFLFFLHNLKEKINVLKVGKWKIPHQMLFIYFFYMKATLFSNLWRSASVVF